MDRLLNGARPAELPVEQPEVYELILNARTAKGLGLKIPATLLAPRRPRRGLTGLLRYQNDPR